MEELFLNLCNGQQKKLLSYFKNKMKITWVEMAKILRVNRSMIFFYCNDSCKMPLNKIRKLCFVSNDNIENFNLNCVLISHGIKNINFPKKNKYLAEFFGILFGDGCISKNNYSVYITCDAFLDYLYIKEIVFWFFVDLFGVFPKIRFQKGAIHCWVYSKKLFNFFSKNNSFPVGKKKNKLVIPFWIKNNEENSIAFIRGLFDTDGGVHKHHVNSIQLGFTSNSPNFLKQVYFLMKNIGLNPKMGKNDIWFFGDSAIDFFKIVKPKNEKHLFKFNKFINFGKVPLSRDLYAGAGIRTQVTA